MRSAPNPGSSRTFVWVRWDWGGCQEGPVIPPEEVLGALGPIGTIITPIVDNCKSPKTDKNLIAPRALSKVI